MTASIPQPETVPYAALRDAKTEVLCGLIRPVLDRPAARLLVVGCGDGREAAVIGAHFGAEAIGIDLEPWPDPDPRVTILKMNAERLDFPDANFDLVYSFHALEHMDDPNRALAEMARVCRPGGGFCVGTPNRSRLVSYLGSPTDAWTKLRWNLIDWRARLAGRFRNEFGAHAGFTNEELATMARRAFGDGRDVSRDYYRALYSGRQGVLDGLERAGLIRYLHASVYIVGRNRSIAAPAA
jgi:SAM-dependent methyltransferase